MARDLPPLPTQVHASAAHDLGSRDRRNTPALLPRHLAGLGRLQLIQQVHALPPATISHRHCLLRLRPWPMAGTLLKVPRPAGDVVDCVCYTSLHRQGLVQCLRGMSDQELCVRQSCIHTTSVADAHDCLLSMRVHLCVCGPILVVVHGSVRHVLLLP